MFFFSSKALVFQRNDGLWRREVRDLWRASVSGTWSNQKSSVFQLNVRVQASRWLSLRYVRLTSNAMTNRSILCFKKAYWKTWVLWTGNTSQHRSYQGISLIVHRSTRLLLGCRVSRESYLPRRRGNGGEAARKKKNNILSETLVKTKLQRQTSEGPPDL